MKYMILFMLILSVTLANAQLDYGINTPDNPTVKMGNPSLCTCSINITLNNETYLNSLFWRLDGTNAPPINDWDMGLFSILRLDKTEYIDTVIPTNTLQITASKIVHATNNNFEIDSNGNLVFQFNKNLRLPPVLIYTDLNVSSNVSATTYYGDGSHLTGIPMDLTHFGDGSNGNCVISVSQSLTANMFCENMTVNDGVVLNASSWIIYVRGTLSGGGKIINNGFRGNATTGGRAVLAGAFKSPGAGANGASSTATAMCSSSSPCTNGTAGAAGTIGTTEANGIGRGINNSHMSGNGGNANNVTNACYGGLGKVGGSNGTLTTNVAKYGVYFYQYVIIGAVPVGGTLTAFGIFSGGGSGAAGGNGACFPGFQAGRGGLGGGAGSQGGEVALVVNIWNFTGWIESIGGHGAPATNGQNAQVCTPGAGAGGGGGGGGGGGACGGKVDIYYNQNLTTFNVNVTGGGGGLHGDGGVGCINPDQNGAVGEDGEPGCMGTYRITKLTSGA